MKIKRKFDVQFDIEPALGHTQKYIITKQYIDGKKVLDVGCWTGQFAKLAVKSAKKVVGLDPDPEAIVHAKKNVPKGEFVIGKASNIPFPDNSFDTVIFSEVIEHLPKNTEKKALKEICRVLKKDGILFLTTPNKHLLSIITDPAFFLTGHRHYSVNNLLTLLEKSGYRVLSKAVRGNMFQALDSNLKLIGKHLFKKKFETPAWVQNKIKSGYTMGGFISIYIIALKNVD